MSRLTPPIADRELAALQQRSARHHAAAREGAHARSISLPQPELSALPERYLLHMLVALLLPISLIVSTTMPLPASPAPARTWLNVTLSDLTLSPPPIALSAAAGDQRVPDTAFAAIDALIQPVVSLPRSQVLAPLAVTASVRDTIKLRAGPGSDYDPIGEATQGEALSLIGRSGDWLQARTATGGVVWLAAEAVDASLAQLSILREPGSLPPPPPPKVASVAESGLSLRDGPGTQYVGIAKLPADQDLTLLARYVSDGTDWFQVVYGEQTGWVSSGYLRFRPGVAERIALVSDIPDPNPALVGSVQGDSAALRAGPGTSFGKQAMLSAGAALDLLGRHNDWFKVRSDHGEGWVFRDLVAVSDYIARRVPQLSSVPTLPRPQQRQAAPAAAPAAAEVASIELPIAAPPPPPAAFAGDLVAFALQFQGTPYVWGGSSPAGFDCSGFTRYVYGQAGLNLPHSAAGQYSTAYGAAIGDAGSLAPGDLVFFANTYQRGISHVGIYIGGGNVVQALSPGYGVGIASLNEGYWAAHFYGAIRPGL